MLLTPTQNFETSNGIGETGEPDPKTPPTKRKVTFSNKPVRIDKTLKIQKPNRKEKNKFQSTQKYNLRARKKGVRLPRLPGLYKGSIIPSRL